MPSFRSERINEEVRREVEHILKNSVKDPGLHTMSSVVRAEVTRDLAHAKIYVSFLEDEQSAQQACMEALKRASGFIRHELSTRLHLRHTPALRFVADDSIAHSADISALLNQIKREEEG